MNYARLSMENTENTKLSKEEYNNIPVSYCKRCLSLRIMILTDNICYCEECGYTGIDEAHIRDWEDKYEEKYNKIF